MSKKNTKANVPVYLLVADDTPEFQVALRYTSQLAKNNDSRVLLLYVMDREDFQHWGTVEKKLHEAYLKEAHDILMSSAETVREISGDYPGFCIQEGGRLDKIIETIDESSAIQKLILGANTKSNNPGPLVSYFTGKGLLKLSVPLIIIPDSVDISKLDLTQKEDI